MIGSLICPAIASAASYGDFVLTQSRLIYENVRAEDDSFGPPTLTEYNLVFDQIDLVAECGDCRTGTTTASSLDFSMETYFGFTPYLSVIDAEFDYSLSTSGDDPDNPPFAAVVAYLIAEVRITSYRDESGSQFGTVETILQIPMSPSNYWSLIEPGEESGEFIALLQLDPGGILSDSGFNGRAKRIDVQIQADLSAYHQGDAGTARIALTGLSVTNYTTNGCLSSCDPDPPIPPLPWVPEPSTALLMGLGLLGLGAGKRSGLVEHHVPARHQEEATVPLEEEATRVRERGGSIEG